MLEHVYGPDAEELAPGALLEADRRNAEPRRLAASGMARLKGLRLDSGYEFEDQPWREDERTPTRLGEDSVRLRLGRWENGFLRPWADDHDLWRAWALSEVSVNAFWVAEVERPQDSGLSAALEAACEAMPDKGKWSRLVPLFLTGNGIWQGRVRDGQGRPVRILYDSRRGLEMSPE